MDKEPYFTGSVSPLAVYYTVVAAVDVLSIMSVLLYGRSSGEVPTLASKYPFGFTFLSLNECLDGIASGASPVRFVDLGF